MTVLKNARWEKFAQAIAAGQPHIKAAEIAGYQPHSSNASRLIRKDPVRSRIDELMGKAAEKVTAPINAIVYDRELLLGYLQEARAMAIDKDKSRDVTAATVAMARILGLIIDRREVGDAGAFDAFTDEELVSAAAKKARELGIEGPRLVEDDEEEPEVPIKGVASTD